MSIADPPAWNFSASLSGHHQHCAYTATWLGAVMFRGCIFPFARPGDHLSVFQHRRQGEIVWCVLGGTLAEKSAKFLALILPFNQRRKYTLRTYYVLHAL